MGKKQWKKKRNDEKWEKGVKKVGKTEEKIENGVRKREKKFGRK